jgi:mono/diheme cytochrome c family protein
MKTKYYLIVLVLVSSVLYSFTYYQAKPWAVPEKNAKMKNPVAGDAEMLKVGKQLFSKHCAVCHGKAGAGDGSKAAQLKTPMEDMSAEIVQNQSDGELFYKMSEGRDEMPAFKKKIPDSEELWGIVSYMRSLKK